MAEFLETTFSRHGTCKLLCDTSLALARSSPIRRYTGNTQLGDLLKNGECQCNQGRTQGGPRPLAPWDLKNTIFSGFLPSNYVICIFQVCFLKLFAMWED